MTRTTLAGLRRQRSARKALEHDVATYRSASERLELDMLLERNDESETAESSPKATTPTSTETSASTTTPTSSAAPSTAHGTAVIAVAKVPVGGSAKATVAGKPVIVARPSAKTVVAHSGICTHQQCPLPAGGKIIECGCHHSRFNTFTGAVVNGPANQPLAAVPVRIDGDNVVTDG